VISGDVLPASFDLQLLSVNGKEVAHFGEENFKALHTGTNELIWNGTDTRGNALPNGIYMYKIVSNLNGKRVEKIGKIVLLKAP
jgi:flagellar hook assembly protein FlgD